MNDARIDVTRGLQTTSRDMPV